MCEKAQWHPDTDSDDEHEILDRSSASNFPEEQMVSDLPWQKILPRELIPIIKNKFQFGRVKALHFDDPKWHCIELILCHLRSSKWSSFHASQTQSYF